MTAAARALATAVAAVVAVTTVVAVVAVGPGEAAGAEPASPPPPAAPATPGDVVILHTDTGADAASARLHGALATLGATVRHTFGAQQAVSVQLPAGLTPDIAGAQLAGLPGVARVERPVVRTLAGDPGTPNDPRLVQQRAYLDAVGARPAWARQHGSKTIRIAVVDTGVDVGHPDLAGKIAGRYNAVDGTSSVTDTVGHGTFVAGVAAAGTGNGVGIAGAGYDSSILAVKVADRDGEINLDDEIAGIRWAADHGAAVINLSLSGTEPSSSELAAVRYAQGKGALVIAAAGNDGDTVTQYPAAYPGVVAVAATDVARGRRAAFSSHGSWVTLAAPGVNLASTVPRAGSEYFPTRTGYARGDGTSFASPLVAGAAALIKAQNPALGADGIRRALVAGSGGYGGNDVGAGQLDFDLALRHVTPATTPLTAVLGTTGSVQLTALSRAPAVAFRVDDDAWLPPVTVRGGSAQLPYSTFGLRNGSHTVRAADCTEFGECNTGSARTAPFVVLNAAPALLTPTAGSTVSGPFTATASGYGAAMQLLVDGTPVAFAAPGQTSFTANGSLVADGPHELAVRPCTATRSHCDGPVSAPTRVTFDSLHPLVTGLDHPVFSPARGTSATVTYSLPEAQDVTVSIVDGSGAARRTAVLGAQAAGSHRWTWDGLADDGSRVADGAYRFAVATADSPSDPPSDPPSGSGGRRGLAERDVRVDTVAPRVTALSGNRVGFYPVRDGYRDAFTPVAALPDGGVLRLVITSARGAVLRVVQATRGRAARTALTWDGRDAAGRFVPTGSYRWRYEAVDEAGNLRRTGTYRVDVSLKRLVAGTVTLTRTAAGKTGSSARCAAKTRSSYRHGAHLVNRCPGGQGDVGYVQYTFTVPAALRYGRLQLQAYGRSARTSQLVASFQRTDGGLEVPAGVRVGKGAARWHALKAVDAGVHLRGRTVRVALVLTSRYRGTNDFDARSVRLRVTLTRLV